MAKLNPSKSPNLPIAPGQYSRQYFDVFSNVLRLYFTQIDGIFANLFGSLGGRYIESPHISATDDTDQYASADDTATQVLFSNLDVGAGFSLSGGQVIADQSGIYKYDYSLQFANTDNIQHTVYVWLEVNGVGLANSTSSFSIPPRKNPTTLGYVVAYSTITYTINAGDNVKLFWATDKAYNPTGPINGVYMEHIDAITTPYTRPANPSAIGSIVFVSRNGT